MVCHKRQCIFIHISKCAGTTVEQAFGVNIKGDDQMGYGWDQTLGIHLQHATPDELLQSGLVSEEQWDTYYKFIIVRNPYARAYSDYAWVMRNGDVWGTFSQFLSATKAFKERLTKRNIDYMGEHLRPQSTYLLKQGKPVAYDTVIRLEEATAGFKKVCADLNLPEGFFDKPANVNKKKLPHYSWFYNAKRRRQLAAKYAEDLKLLAYTFTDQRPTKFDLLNDVLMLLGKNAGLHFRLKYPFLAYKWGNFKRKIVK